ncbi:MAG: isoprenoid biosynthesis glyoxalase ElbB [Candidatus Sumerlaeaceae bacterium]|nr:isoprenoid biosynthesis glyoxalase ElbB [Candidatus Sumerlaeaceae bacterium]
MGKRVALLLSGCGVMDGAEIQEATYALLALDNAGAEVACCAPNINQTEVVNHFTGEKTGETRNILAEAARIARGKIIDLAKVKAADYNAIIVPGGYGAAKNLGSYAFDGVKLSINPEVQRVLREFHAGDKPIGTICISPVIVARAFQGTSVKPTLTIGNDAGTAKDIEALGAEHVTCGVKDCVVDKANKIVSTPAYMYHTTPSQVFAGIEKLVKAVLELA